MRFFFISGIMIIVEIYDINLSLLRLKANKNAPQTLIELKNILRAKSLEVNIWRFSSKWISTENVKYWNVVEDKLIYLIFATTKFYGKIMRREITNSI